jgi:undecaprenyl-diphosphatase
MYLYHIVILALVQGITEFLPISSSAHLILSHAALGGEAQADDPWGQQLMIDVAVHVGTLFSVLLYFRKDLIAMFTGTVRAATQQRQTGGLRLGLHVILASVPVIITGAALSLVEPAWLRSIEVIAWTTLIFGILLWVADRFFPSRFSLEDMKYRSAFMIGLAQALALIPGVSRSGVTMTAGRFCGFARTEAAKFSLLLSIPAISGAGALQARELVLSGDFALGADVLTAAFLAFLSGWAAIALMMRWLARATFTPFVIYRIGLGLVLLGLFYGTSYIG